MLIIATVARYAQDELESALAEALADPAFVPGTAVLFDGRQSEADLSRADIEWRVYWLSSLPQRGFARRSAVLVNSEPHRFGLASGTGSHQQCPLRLRARGLPADDGALLGW